MTADTDTAVRSQPRPQRLRQRQPPGRHHRRLGPRLRQPPARRRHGLAARHPRPRLPLHRLRLAQRPFLTTYNMANLVIQAGSIIVLAMGIVFVLLLGEIDLSAGVAGGACGDDHRADAHRLRLDVVGGDPGRRRRGCGDRPRDRLAGRLPGHPVLRRHPRLLPRPAGGPAQADRLGRLAALQRRGAARPLDQERAGHRRLDRRDPHRRRLRRALAVALPLALAPRAWSTSRSAW